jgi:arylsulfatase A-like enzyme
MALNVLDQAVSDIYDSVKAKGVVENTYFIFASDNGGCPEGGGRNEPLRGKKGSLFEGESYLNLDASVSLEGLVE